MQLKPLSDQVVVVVGAGSGIGRETALRLARRGAKVVVSGRGEPGLNSLVDEIRRTGGEATAVAADVAEFDQVQAIADQAAATYGRIDTWVQLASAGIWATFEQTTPAEFKRVVDVNLTGQAYGMMAALPYLRAEGRGALIHISSIEAHLPIPLQSAYGAAKHGLAGLIDVVRMELAHEGVPISVTNIMPSGINTPFFDKARTKLGVKPKPLPPIYQPHLVADAILYAAEHPRREVFVGGGGAAAVIMRRIAPRLLDGVLQRVAFSLQRTNTPKSADAAHNLFEPITGYDQVTGDFDRQAKSWSLYTGLALRPTLRRTLLGATAAVAAAGVLRAVKRI